MEGSRAGDGGSWGWGLGGVVDRVETRCRDGGDFCRGRDFDKFGVTIPFSAAGVAAPAILASFAISPLQ